MDVLRLQDGRTGSYVELASRPSIPLRMCIHGTSAGFGSGLADVRLLIVADVLTRIAELGGRQVIAVLTAGNLPPGWLDQTASALNLHPPATCGSFEEAETMLGGPADVHVAGTTPGPRGRGTGTLLDVGPVHDVGDWHDGLPLRLALLSCRYHDQANLTRAALAEAGESLRRWRRSVAEWACEPSRPIPRETAREIAAAFDDDLNTTAVLAVLHRLESDLGVPAGAKFETFAFADRVLGLDVVSEIGHLR
jgi:hypothetical protein